MDDIPCFFKTSVSQGLICSFCNSVFTEPVLATPCGHSFCKKCTEGKNVCPLDDKGFDQIIPNISLSDQINQLDIHCRYGCKFNADYDHYEIDEEGCTEIIKFGDRNDHESECIYSFVECSQNARCGLIRKKDLQQHLEVCQKVSCIHEKYGCTYKGLLHDQEAHLQTCNYEAIKGFLAYTETKLCQLQENIEINQNEKIDMLNSQITILHQKMNSLIEENRKFMSEYQVEIVALRNEINYFKNDLNGLNEYVNVLSRYCEAMDFNYNFRCLGTFVGHQGAVWCMVVYGDLLFTGSSDTTIKVWQLASDYHCVKTLEGHQSSVLCLTISNKRIYSGGKDNTIGEWCMENLTNLTLVKDAHSKDYVSAIASNELYVVSGSNGSIKIWKVKHLDNGALHEIRDLNYWVRCLSLKDNDLYVGVNDIFIYSLKFVEKNECLAVGNLVLPKSEAHIVTLLFLDQTLVSGNSIGDIHIWDLTQKSIINTLSGHSERVNSLSCLLGGGVWKLFSASNDRTIRVWRLDKLTCSQILARHQGSVQSVVLWKGRLFSAAVDASIKVWSTGS